MKRKLTKKLFTQEVHLAEAETRMAGRGITQVAVAVKKIDTFTGNSVRELDRIEKPTGCFDIWLGCVVTFRWRTGI
jgi:hypothetical protein